MQPGRSNMAFVSQFLGSLASTKQASGPREWSSIRGACPRASSAKNTSGKNGGVVSGDFLLPTDADWSLGVVRAPRPKRGRIGGRHSVHVQGKGYRKASVAPAPPGLRVAGGSVRGRKLASPQVHLRPMMGVVREALYSMLSMMDALTPEGAILDLFAGSGSVGIEALSRGMDRAVFVDAADDCAQTITGNLKTCGFADSGTVICSRVENSLEAAVSANNGSHFDLITLTPPYEEVDYGVLMSSITASRCVGEGTFVVVEYPVELRSLPPAIGGRLVGLRNRRYGRTVLAIYACQPDIDLEPRPHEFIDVR